VREGRGGLINVWVDAEDGHEIKLDTSKMAIKDVVEEVDRHSRMLGRKADLSG
jgi:large subunit ribosomal protein L53